MAGQRIHVTIGHGRAAMLRHRAQELGVPVARLAAQMIDQAVDRLASDEAFLTRWEDAARRRAEELKLKESMGGQDMTTTREELSRYYCPSCCDERAPTETCGYFPMNGLPSDLCCPECGTALEYDDPLEEQET